MLKDEEKIIITRKYDMELYDLISRLEVVKFGTLHFHFDKKDLKDVVMQKGKPLFVVVEETIKLENCGGT